MATYTIDGQVYHFPEGTTQEQAQAIVQQDQRQSVAPTQNQPNTGNAPANGNVGAGNDSGGAYKAPPAATNPIIPGSIDPNTLKNNSDWITASRIRWMAANPGKAVPSNEDLAEFGLDEMGWFNYNSVKMGVDAARIRSASAAEKKAFLYLLETYDKLDLSWGGAGRFIKGAATDPLNYVGLSTLGIGLAGKEGVQLATKEGIKQLLRAGITTGIEGAIIVGAQDRVRQQAEINAGGRTEADWGQVGTSAAIGAAGGAVLGAAAEGAGMLIRGARSAKEALPSVPGREVPATPTEAAGGAPSAAGNAVPQPEVPKAPEGMPTPANENVAGAAVPPTPAAPTGPTRFDAQGIWKSLEDSKGAVDLKEFTAKVNEQIQKALDSGQKVTLFADGKPIDIVKIDRGMMADAKGQRWGTMALATDREGKLGNKLEFSGGQAAEAVPTPKPTAEAPKAEAPAAPAPKPPVVDPDNNPIIQAVRQIQDYGFRSILRGGERAAAAAPIVEKLLNMDPGHMTRLIEEVRHASLNGAQGNVLVEAIRQATKTAMQDLVPLAERAKAGDAAAKQALAQANKLEALIRRLDLDVSSNDATKLGARSEGKVGGLNTGAMREISVDKILEQQNWPRTPENIEKAQYLYAEKIAERMDQLAKNKRVVELDDLRLKAIEAGDMEKAATYTAERNAELEKALIEDTSLGAKFKGMGNGFLRGLNEVFIANVFSPGTAVINILPAVAKMIYRPITDAILRDPLDHISWRIAAAQYAAYTTNLNAALKAASLAFRYERGLLSGDFVLYAGRDPVLPKTLMGLPFGGVIRFIPRVLGASDELFSQLSYRAYIQSEALGKALIEARANGLTKGAARQYAVDQVAKAMENSFEKHVGGEAFDMLYREGLSRGYRDEKLAVWVKSQIDANKDFFKTATNTTGLGYAEDMLFKREFSGEGTVSSVAKHYEQIVNKHPVLRLMGQLFFRTPVRVFEEGFRLTPGLNVISGVAAGQFLSDLRGLNGLNSQLRAQGEAMLSLAIGAMVIQNYASGKLTGGGPDDWKLRRTLEDGGDWAPYTWKIGDFKLNYRNLDPLATPIKIITNVMDRLYTREYRRAQGEYDNKSEYQKVASLSAAVSLSIVQAIRDANLTEGLDQIIRFVGDVTDPEHKESALLKFLGQKAQLLVPNTIQKVQSINNPQLNDPVGPEDFLRNRLNPSDPLIPKRYDALGDVVTNPNPWGSLIGVNLDLNPKTKFTKREEIKQVLGKLGFNGEKEFIAPYTVSYLDKYRGVDLRTLPTKQGISFYDAWQQEISRSPMANVLYNIVVLGKSLPMGTKSDPGAREQAATEIINAFRQQAFQRVLQREHPGLELVIQGEMEKAKALSGIKDVKFYGPYTK